MKCDMSQADTAHCEHLMQGQIRDGIQLQLTKHQNSGSRMSANIADFSWQQTGTDVRAHIGNVLPSVR